MAARERINTQQNQQLGTDSIPHALSLCCHAKQTRLIFQPARIILAAVEEAVSAKGFQSAVVELEWAFEALVYATSVIPAGGPGNSPANE